MRSFQRAPHSVLGHVGARPGLRELPRQLYSQLLGMPLKFVLVVTLCADTLS